MNTNKTGYDGFQKYMRPFALAESSLSIGRVKWFPWECYESRVQSLKITYRLLGKYLPMWGSFPRSG